MLFFMPLTFLEDFKMLEFFSAQGGDQKQETGDHGNDEMDIGDMDKLEQDTGNIGEVWFSFIVDLVLTEII